MEWPFFCVFVEKQKDFKTRELNSRQNNTKIVASYLVILVVRFLEVE